jgi:hypothetical protein
VKIKVEIDAVEVGFKIRYVELLKHLRLLVR